MSDCVKTLFIGGFMDGERVPKRFERYTRMVRRVDYAEMFTTENYREERIACDGVEFRIMIVESMSMLDAMKRLVDGYSGPRLDEIYGLVARIRKVDGDFNTFLNECAALTEYLAPNIELKKHDYARMKILIAIAVDWISRHGRSDDGCHEAASSHRATPTHGQSVSGYPEQVPAVRGLDARCIDASIPPTPSNCASCTHGYDVTLLHGSTVVCGPQRTAHQQNYKCTGYRRITLDEMKERAAAAYGTPVP